MQRRRHKKSRGGCLTCKQRHIKCDEGQPSCLICTIASRECSYPPKRATRKATSLAASESIDGLLTPGPTDRSKDISPSDGKGQATGAQPTILTPSSSPNHPEQETPAFVVPENPGDDLGDDLNMDHMELYVHLNDTDLFSVNLANESFDLSRDIPILLKTGFDYPYLMHQALAFSSCRLGFLNPTKKDFYQNQATRLQTRAISLFNANWTAINESNCMAVVLFSALLGHQLLAEVLAKRDPGGLNKFMNDCLHFLEMQKGIRVIFKSARPHLMNSALEPFLSASARFNARPIRGNDCSGVFQMIHDSSDLVEEDKTALLFMAEQLQIGFDAARNQEQEGYKHYMVYTWLINASQEFIDLFSAKRPEALVLLAYYAVLLHFARGKWQVGNSGAYVFRITQDYLGEKWRPWLQYPLQIITGELA